MPYTDFADCFHPEPALLHGLEGLGFTDTSCLQDAMPSFEKPAGAGLVYRVWVDAAQESDSEFHGVDNWQRFGVVLLNSDNGQEVADLFSGSDTTALLVYLAQLPPSYVNHH